MSKPRYPEIVVDLSNVKLNYLGTIGAVTAALEYYGVPDVIVKEFVYLVTGPGKETLMKTVREWVNIKTPVCDPISDQEALATNCLDKITACRRDLQHIMDTGSSGCELNMLDLSSTILRLDGAIKYLSEAI